SMARLGGQAGLTDAYLAALLSFTGLVAAGYAVSTVLRLRSEETDGHADPVLATGAGRISWGIAHVAIAAGGTAAIMALVGLGTASASLTGPVAAAPRSAGCWSPAW